jgi:hypothetical protein
VSAYHLTNYSPAPHQQTAAAAAAAAAATTPQVSAYHLTNYSPQPSPTNFNGGGWASSMGSAKDAGESAAAATAAAAAAQSQPCILFCCLADLVHIRQIPSLLYARSAATAVKISTCSFAALLTTLLLLPLLLLLLLPGSTLLCFSRPLQAPGAAVAKAINPAGEQTQPKAVTLLPIAWLLRYTDGRHAPAAAVAKSINPAGEQMQRKAVAFTLLHVCIITTAV